MKIIDVTYTAIKNNDSEMFCKTILRKLYNTGQNIGFSLGVKTSEGNYKKIKECNLQRKIKQRHIFINNLKSTFLK